MKLHVKFGSTQTLSVRRIVSYSIHCVTTAAKSVTQSKSWKTEFVSKKSYWRIVSKKDFRL